MVVIKKGHSEQGPDYVIYKNGSNIKVLNCSTGVVFHSGTNAPLAMQAAFDKVTAGENGGSHVHMNRGLYEMNAGVDMGTSADEGVKLTGSFATYRDEGTVLKATAALNPMIDGKSDFTTIRDIEIDGANMAIVGAKLRKYDNMLQWVSIKQCEIGVDIGTNTWIRNCWIEQNEIGLRSTVNKEWFWITENIFWGNTKTDVEVHAWNVPYRPWWLWASKNKHMSSDNGYYFHLGNAGETCVHSGISIKDNGFWGMGEFNEGAVHDNCIYFGDGDWDDIIITGNIARGKDSGGTQRTADFLEFSGAGTYADVIVANNRVRDMSANYINGRGNVTRLLLDGLGYNAGNPGAAGDWNGQAYEGLIIRDTTNNKTYLYADGGWREISAA